MCCGNMHGIVSGSWLASKPVSALHFCDTHFEAIIPRIATGPLRFLMLRVALPCEQRHLVAPVTHRYAHAIRTPHALDSEETIVTRTEINHALRQDTIGALVRRRAFRR